MSTETTTEQSPIDRAAKVVGGVAALAAKIRVTASLPSMWKTRGAVPADHCAAIEAATDRAVMRWHLRPQDWHRIWPELIGQPGAPSVAQSTEAAGA